MKSTVERVAVVTGANKGIGYAIVKGLCQNFNGKVYLTARIVSNGIRAVKELEALGLNPTFHQLDISDQTSINTFRNHILETDGGIDVLVNNAGIYLVMLYAYISNIVIYLFQDKKELSFPEQAKGSIDVNYFGTVNVCNALVPILRDNGQLINVSSSAGHLNRIPCPTVQAKFRDCDLTLEKLNNYMNEFVDDAKNNKHVEKGWGSSAYVVSKVGVSAFTILLQKQLDEENKNRNIFVNSVHPGRVATDMNENTGVLTIEQGAVAPLHLALDDHGLRGQYMWFNKEVVDWYGPTTPPKQ
ncbi:hypothetical protein FQA39_LY13410 [Lamprigera yunnana]|nr:hypothetical protein FQA39_LY13410 [Lamprigera yunnana]